MTRLTFAMISVAGSAGATVTEPDGRTVPIMTAEGPNLELATLFTSRGETIDWQKDALTSPAVFSPLCSFTGTLLVHGGGCRLDLCWYNAVASGGAPPPDNEIYTLVPANFPGVGDMRPQVGDPAPPPFTANDIRMNANYKGGLIGFALRGSAGQECTQTHYSQPELNLNCPACTTPGHWTTAVIYKSTATPNAYYVAFEDLPVSPTIFDPPTGEDKNDGDFNDFVFFLTGLTCEGGGKPCDTGKPGVCASGITDCSPTGQPNVCRQKVDPSAEKCDNIDNDCNGKVDDGDLCQPGYVCNHGTCVFACGGGEFSCPSDLKCDRQFCVDPLCVGIDCPATQVCRAGKCIDPCTDVACPKGQVCEKGVGRCVDVCAGIKCDNGDVCEDGACVSPCACRTCGTGKACSAAGPCVDTGCEAKTCDKGSVCVLGNCVDACEGAKCPGGAACSAGQCGDPPDGGATGGPVDASPGDSTWVGGGGLNAGSGGSASGGAAGTGPGEDEDASANTGVAGSTDERTPSKAKAGCACDLAGHSRSDAPIAVAGVALALLGLRRRRLDTTIR